MHLLEIHLIPYEMEEIRDGGALLRSVKGQPLTEK